MASPALPKFQELRQLPDEDKAKLLDEFIRDLGTYLSQTPRFEAREMIIAGGASASVALSYPPKGVLVSDVRELDDAGTTASVESPDWIFETDDRGVGQLTIRALEGLTAGTAYRVRLLVER
jgi:hypothetical protein